MLGVKGANTTNSKKPIQTLPTQKVAAKMANWKKPKPLGNQSLLAKPNHKTHKKKMTLKKQMTAYNLNPWHANTANGRLAMPGKS